MTPYYERDNIRIYHGDCREVLPALGETFDACITDPVWPNALPSLAGSDDPQGLLASALDRVEAKRVVVHLGRNSDPRFLSAVPSRWPFLAVCWLRYARPSYLGRLLNGADVAYLFGEYPPVRDGQQVIPGEMCNTSSERMPKGHPCARRLQHVEWLVRWFACGVVVDPFSGSGTTLVACRNAGIPAVGMEVDEAFCELAANRLAQRVIQWDEEGVA